MNSMQKYKCCNCDEISTAEQINTITTDCYCVNRKQRREYTPIEKTKQTDHKWYTCPNCGKNIRRFGWKEV